MPMLKLTVGQVIDLVKQLPQEDKFAVLHALKPEIEMPSEQNLKRREEQKLRSLSAQRGLDWDNLSEDDRDVLRRKLVT
ncbi:MAG: hypothetical protein LDL41_05105 [Coleofasciculus sp. S288]|nr:hypothetical protein [Coleofasciculus sp. S288]